MPCVFQIWEQKVSCRLSFEPKEANGFRYVKPKEKYHIALRRVGGTAGTCYVANTGEFNPQCFHFLLFDDEFVPLLEQIIQKINSHEFPSNTVGPRSLSKSEINEALNQILEEEN